MRHDDTVDTLNDLIETSKDGEFGFRTAAECVRSEETKQVLSRRADECRRAAEELAAYVLEYGGTAQVGGTASGAMHRGWITLKSKLATYPDKVILEETEKGEDSAMAHYRRALERELPDTVRDVVARQYEGVKRNHLQVRTLRDQARAEVAASR
jgi:uncharacterized protein (TIGR02284 family)